MSSDWLSPGHVTHPAAGVGSFHGSPHGNRELLPEERELDFEEATDKRLLHADAHLLCKHHCSDVGRCGRTVGRPLPLAQGWGWWAGPLWAGTALKAGPGGIEGVTERLPLHHYLGMTGLKPNAHWARGPAMQRRRGGVPEGSAEPPKEDDLWEGKKGLSSVMTTSAMR